MMSKDFENFRNKATGQVVRLPVRYGELFPDSLCRVDEDVECSDCVLPPTVKKDTVEATAVEGEYVIPSAGFKPTKNNKEVNND